MKFLKHFIYDVKLGLYDINFCKKFSQKLSVMNKILAENSEEIPAEIVNLVGLIDRAFRNNINLHMINNSLKYIIEDSAQISNELVKQKIIATARDLTIITTKFSNDYLKHDSQIYEQ